jgi:hypothetical protein
MKKTAAHLAVFALFLAVGAALTWPTVLEMREGAWGRTWDMFGNLWFFDHARHMLTEGDFSFETTRIFFPFGYDLRADLAHFLLPGLAAPLQLLLSLQPIEVYNIFLLLALGFSGYAAFVLARRFTASNAGAAVAALLWIGNPITVRELAAGSLEVAFTGFLVFAFWALLRLLDAPSPRRAVTFGVFWLLAGFTNWVMAGMFGLVVVTVGAWSLWRKPAAERVLPAKLLGAAIAVTALFALPFVGPLIPGQDLTMDETDQALARLTNDAELARQLLDRHSDRNAQLIGDSFDPGDFFVAQDAAAPTAPLLWWALAMLSLLALADRERRVGWLVALGGGFAVLACGPYLRWFNHFGIGASQWMIPLPAWLPYKLVPGFDLFYRPYRFMLPAGLLLIGPTAVGAAWLVQLRQRRATRIGAALVLVLVAGAFSLAAYQADGGAYREVHVASEYDSVIRELPGNGLLEIPFFPLPVSDVNALAMVAQKQHLKSIFNATLLRTPAWREMAEFAESNSVIGAWLDLQLGRADRVAATYEDAVALRNMGFDWILIHTSFAESDATTDRFRRVPHELILLTDRLYGAPRELSFARLYDARGASGQGEAVASPEAVARLRFTRLYNSADHGRTLVGHVSVDLTGGDGEKLAVSAPKHAANATHFCGWIRPQYLAGEAAPIDLEMTFDGNGKERVWRTQLPLSDKPDWQWRCVALPEDIQPANATSLRFSSTGRDIVVNLDDAAFVRLIDPATL